MSLDIYQLARLLVSHEGFFWAYGMRWRDLAPSATTDRFEGRLCESDISTISQMIDEASVRIVMLPNVVPVLSDPATMGCVVNQLEKFLNDPDIYLARVGRGWEVRSTDAMRVTGYRTYSWGPTKMEAVVSAFLES